MAEHSDITDEKIAKTKVIEGMLGELNMSKQELIDLINSLLNQSVSEEKDQELLQSISENRLKELPFLGDNIEGLPQSLTIEELSQHIANGDINYLSKYLSLEQLKKLSIRVGLAFSLNRAKELGLILDSNMLSQLIGIPGVKDISLKGNIKADGRDFTISSEKAEKLAGGVNDLTNQREIGQDQQHNKNKYRPSHVKNNPASLNNPNASVSIINRVVSSIRMQMASLGLTAGAALTTRSSLGAQQQQQQQQQIQNMTRNIERTFRQMNRHEKKVKKMFPEIDKVKTKGKDVFASVKTKGGEKEVNLKDYLRGSNKLSGKAEKLIDSISNLSGKINRSIDQLSVGLPEAKAFQLDASGRMQVQVEENKTMKMVNISDYINDLRRDLERMKTKVTAKKEEVQLKKTEATDKERIERAKDLSRGPELDNASLAAARQIASEHESSLKYFQTNKPSEGVGEEKPKEVKESKRMADELVKLDAMHDKNKMLEAMKGGSTELKQIESSMKEVMKDMKEAEKNKDLLKEMQLAKKDKFLDKT